MNSYEINAKGDTATILIYELIGEDFFDEGLTAKQFAKDLEALGKVKEINVRINSPGGSIFDARGMASLLKAHPARKVVDIDGICASAATYPACAGDLVRMAFDGTYMIHEPAGLVMGTAIDMRKEADVLDKLQTAIIATYTDFTGQPQEDIRKLVVAETWMSGQEALDLGFVHELTGQKNQESPVDLSKMLFRNVPERLVNHNSRNPLKLVAENGRVKVRFSRGESRLDRAKNRVEHMRMKLENSGMRSKEAPPPRPDTQAHKPQIIKINETGFGTKTPPL